MYKMFAIICAVTVFECNVAMKMKGDLTREQLTDEDGYLTVEHLEFGCERADI